MSEKDAAKAASALVFIVLLIWFIRYFTKK